MTTVPAVSSATNAKQSDAAANAAATSVDYNTFLQLLVAQLKNQDPTQPMDSTQFLSQLASFSQVEQTISSNSKLDSLLTSSSLSLADAVIGKTVTSADGTVSGTVSSVRITSDGPIATLKSGETVTLSDGIVIS
jgi:flagellar basal-body rod modification protein FlgD